MVFVIPGKRFNSPWPSVRMLGETVEGLTRRMAGLHTGAADEPRLILAPVHPLWSEALTRAAYRQVISTGQPCAGYGMVCYPPGCGNEALELAREGELEVPGALPFDFGGALPVRDAHSFAEVAKLLCRRAMERHEGRGVVFLDPGSVLMGPMVEIGEGAVIYPNSVFEGTTRIGPGAVIYPDCHFLNAEIGAGTLVRASTIENSCVGADCTVGPYAYLREGTSVGDGVRIGDFVEMKNARFGDASCAAHLAYIGDADVGKRVNIGCGVIFCNYDGFEKHMSTVCDDAFIGSDAVLIAPRTVGEGAYVAACSAVTEDVESGALYIARARGVQKSGWAGRMRALRMKQEKKGSDV